MILSLRVIKTSKNPKNGNFIQRELFDGEFPVKNGEVVYQIKEEEPIKVNVVEIGENSIKVEADNKVSFYVNLNKMASYQDKRRGLRFELLLEKEN